MSMEFKYILSSQFIIVVSTITTELRIQRFVPKMSPLGILWITGTKNKSFLPIHSLQINQLLTNLEIVT